MLILADVTCDKNSHFTTFLHWQNLMGSPNRVEPMDLKSAKSRSGRKSTPMICRTAKDTRAALNIYASFRRRCVLRAN